MRSLRADFKVISTFAGGGGSSLGYSLAGAHVLAAVEYAKQPAATYRLNHKNTKVYEQDIATLSVENMKSDLNIDVGELDLLDGSPPCQGFSMAGKRLVDDPRNSLFLHQIRIIKGLHPRFVVIENVPGMFVGKHKSIGLLIKKTLSECGYRTIVGQVEAAAFGVPQRRARCFFIGSRDGNPRFPKTSINRVTTSGEALNDVVPKTFTKQQSEKSLFWCDRINPGEDVPRAAKRMGINETSWFGAFMLHPERVSPTITKKNPFLGPWHWSRRLLSVEEAAALTGFPSDYCFSGNPRDAWGVIGNSVSPPISRAICESLMSNGA